MRSPLCFGLFFLLLSLFTAVPAKVAAGPEPQPLWLTYGIEINDTKGNTPQQNCQAVYASDNSFIVVWEDSRFGNPLLYAQKIDESGQPLWPNGGVSLCGASNNQTIAKITADQNGGAIVVWQDFRNGNSDIYAQRLGSRGELVWDGEGVAVCQAAAGQFAPELVSDGAGGAIIAWHDYRGGIGEDVYAQRIDQGGNPLWGKNGAVVCNEKGTQWYPKIAEDGEGGAVIVWSDGRAGSSDNNIFAQRFSAAGKTLWEKGGTPVCAAAGNQERPVIVKASDGLIAAWNDSRGSNPDIYAQKIDFSGGPLWEKEGKVVARGPFSQLNPQLVSDGNSGAVVAWTDNREDENSVHVQKLSGLGDPEWGDGGRAVAADSDKQGNPSIARLGSSWLVIWEDSKNGGPALYAQKFNNAGARLWPEGGMPVIQDSGGQEKSVVASGPGGLAIFWQDRRFGTFDIYAQKLTSDGEPLWGSNGSVVCNATGSVNHQNAVLTNSGNGSTFVVFEDARSGFFNIYSQKVSANGTLLFGADGLPVAKVRANQSNPQVISDQSGGIIAAWEDARTPTLPKIFCQRLLGSGKKGWGKGSLQISPFETKQGKPLIVPDGAGGAIVVWQEERDPLSLKDLFAQRISPTGDLLWGKGGAALAAENGDQVEAAVVPDNEGGIIVAWTDYRRGERNPDIYAQRISDGGKPRWTRGGVLVCGAPDIQRTPKLLGDGAGGAFITWTDKGGGSYDIYAQKINAAGQTQWLTDGIPVNQAPRTQQTPTPGGQQAVIWEDYRFGNWDIFAGAVSPSGKLLWGEASPVAVLPQTQYSPCVINWSGNSLIVAWEDYRSGKHYEIYLQKIDSNGKSEWRENGALVRSRNGARAPKLCALPEDESAVVVWEDYGSGGKALFGQKYSISQ